VPSVLGACVGWFAARCVLIHRLVSHLLLLLWSPVRPSPPPVALLGYVTCVVALRWLRVE
jgi:TRAP-type uncharacterized transport system fused permease subunit